MSSLREIVRNRTSAPAELVSENAMRGLQVHAWNGERWVFPWGYFHSAHLSGTPEKERILLLFAQHEVDAEGVRLGLFLPEIAAYRLELLRELPVNFQMDARTTEPFVSRLVVRPRDTPDTPNRQ